MDEVFINPTKTVKLKFNEEKNELHEAIDSIINMIDINLYDAVFEYAGCLGEPPELLVKGSYVDKVYFIETLLIYLTEEETSKLKLYHDNTFGNSSP